MSVDTDMADLYSRYLAGLPEPTPEQAAQVLAVLVWDTGNPQPPTFVDLLIATMAEATLDQLQRLASGYAGYARAVHMLQHEYGTERLRAIATGRERVDIGAARTGEQPASTMLTAPDSTLVDVELGSATFDEDGVVHAQLYAECGCPIEAADIGDHLDDCPDHGQEVARGA